MLFFEKILNMPQNKKKKEESNLTRQKFACPFLFPYFLIFT